MTQQYVINTRRNGNKTLIIQEDPYGNGWNGFGYGYGFGGGRWGRSRYVYNQPQTIIIKEVNNQPRMQRPNIPIGKPLKIQNNDQLNIPISQPLQKQSSFENYVVSTAQSTKLYQCEGYSKQYNKKIFVSLTNSQFCVVNLNYLSKLKMKVGSPHSTYHTLKLTSADKQYFYFFKIENLEEMFARIFWVRMSKLKYFGNVQKKGIVSGVIFKKSQFLGEWEQRYTIIDSQGLKSAYSRWQQPTVVISSTKQLWTRFQIVKLYKSLQAFHVVIKLWHGWIKYQFAVPVQDFGIWIRGFASLIQNKIQGK